MEQHVSYNEFQESIEELKKLLNKLTKITCETMILVDKLNGI